jgi:hypothetical protein
MKKAWAWANTPLTTSLFGLPEERAGAGGFERGVEHIVAGLTSPLSVALTAATFGTGGFIESAGTTALKESGEFTAEEIAQIAKGSKIALDTMKAQTPIEPVIADALKAAHTPEELDLLKLAKAKVDPAGLNPEFQFGKDSYQGLPGKPGILEKVGLSPKQVDDFAEGKLSPAEREAIAVKNGGFSDKEISTLGNIGETVRKAETEFDPIAEAVKNEGIDPSLLKRGEKVLYDNGLNQTDLLGRDLAERGAFQIIRNAVPSLPIKVAARAARTAHVLMTGGFTLQQLEMASQMSPRFLDALKEGDYDHAWEYGTEAFAGAAMGILGAPHVLHSAGELFHPLIEEGGFRPSDNWVAADRINKQREVVHAVAEQQAINIHKAIMDSAGLPTEPGLLGWSKDQLAALDHAKKMITIGHQFEPEELQKLRTTLEQALIAKGMEPPGGPLSGLPPVGTPIIPEEIPTKAGQTKQVFSTPSGEVRVGSNGQPIIFVGEDAWGAFKAITKVDGPGVSYSPREADEILDRFSPDSSIGQLIAHARKWSDSLAVVKAPGDNSEFSIKVVAEELHHSLDRWLTTKIEGKPSGEIQDHLNPSDWDHLYDILPERQHSYLDANNYVQDPVVRVAETAAKYRAGIIPEEVTDEEAARWLNEYRKAVEAKHGPQTPGEMNRINEIAAQHVKDIYEARGTGQVPSDGRVADNETGPGKLPGLGKGARGPAGLGEEEPGGVRGETPEGLGAHEVTGRYRAREKGELFDYNRAKELFRAVLPSEIAKDAIGKLYSYTGGNKWVTQKELDWIADRAQRGLRGLASKELDKEPVGFASPSVHNLSLADVALRLNSRPQKLIERLSNDFAQALPGVRAQVRPAIGHWEGGAENTTVHRFAPGTNPDAVEYHNAFVAKVGYQNMGMGFIPGEGNDVLFQFRVPGRFTPNEIAGVLEAHGIPGDTIEPIPGGNLIHIVSEGGKLQPQVSEIASRLDAEKVEQTYGRKFEHGSYDSRDAAQAVLENRLSEIEERHPEWRAIRNSFESRPDHVELSRLTRETKQPFLEATHGSRTPGLETITPEMFGKGPQKGAEQARAKAYPEDFPKRSYFQVNDTRGEPFYTHQAYQYKARFNSENLYDLARDPDGLLSKAQQEAAARKMPGPDALWTIYERLIKDSGYEGGYKPDGTLMAFKDTPVESILKKDGVEGLFAKERQPAEWDDVKQHLTPEELKKHDTPEKQRMLTAAFNAMPNVVEWSAAVRAGASGRLWYERSSRAFDALLDSGADWIKPKDKPKFLNLVAALSPVQPVKANLLMALNLWAKWDKAGRPTDVTWDGKQVQNKNASLYRILKGRGQTQGVDLPARMNNSIRALQGEPLSGPKVSAFTTNLGRDVNRVTNDTWMAVFGDQDPNTINKPHLYDALSAHSREAGKAEGIPPRQAQAAVWSFIKSLAELSGWGNDRWIPPQEIIKQGLLTPDLVSAHASDFADLLSHDPEIRGRIQSLGGDLNALDAKLKARVPERPAAGEAQTAALELLGPAGRLEAARSNARTQAHLARKQEGGLFDTNFRPDNGLFAKERENRAPQWYLKSNQLVDSRMSGPMPAETVLKMLENNGVKPDELKYTGLSDFLKEKGKEPVRPEEVKQFLDANNLQIHEVMKGGENYRVYNPSRPDKSIAEFPTEQEAHAFVMSNLGKDGLPKYDVTADPEPSTKFSGYVTPGANPGSYREMLLTLPGESERGRPAPLSELPKGYQTGVDYSQTSDQKYHIIPPGQVHARPFSGRHATPEAAQQAALQRLNDEQTYNWRTKQGDSIFRGPHWDEPDVVGHVRFNDRTGPNGEKLLHLEELQSDWHQKGRTQGYQGKTAKVVRTPKEDEGGYAPSWEIRYADGNLETVYAPDEAGALRIAEAHGASSTGGVPDAPFKKTWPELLMKRMIRYAAENGYDGVSWTPGEEQAARYSLRTVADEVRYDPKGQRLYTYKDGAEQGSHPATPEELPGLIGKEVSKKLLETPKVRYAEVGWVPYDADQRAGTDVHILKGDNLEVGGQGMKGFYDKIVPETANKLGKQFGAKVGETEIGGSPLRAVYDPASGKYMVSRGGHASYDDDVLDSGYNTKEQAEAAIRNKYKGDKGSDSKTVPYFPITDSMRESVLSQGQPLFAKESPDNGQLQHQIDTNEFYKQPQGYRDGIFKAIDELLAGAPKNIQDAIKTVRNEDGKNYELGAAYDLIHHFIDNHLHRMYEDDNPTGRVINSQAKGGKFSTNVSMARRQVYDSFTTALLKSPKKIVFDPAKVVAGDRADIIKAAANKQFIAKMRDDFVRGSDGLPAVVLSGSGKVVSGPNGEDPKTMVYPGRVSKINVSDSVIDHLKKTGDFDRFIEQGSLKDITPKVRPDNIGAAIDRLTHEAETARGGTGENVKYDEEGNNVLRQQIKMLEDVRDGKRPWSDVQGPDGYNSQIKPVYAWDPQGYITLDTSAVRGWNFVTNDPSGHQVLVDADVRVHPEFAEYFKNRLGLEPSQLQKNPVSRALLGAGTKLKQTLLSLSPFHMVQIALRGVMTGVNPFTLHGPDIIDGAKVDPADPQSPTILHKAVEQGATLGADYKALQEHSEGLAAGGGLMRMIPGVGGKLAGAMDWYQDFLFKRYIPAIKATAIEHMFREYQNMHPEWSVDKVAKAAAMHANDSFGGINWQAMGRSATTQDWGRLLLLAPDWLEAEMRSGIRLFNKEEGGLGRKQVAMMAMGLWAVARVLNYLTTGQGHYEAPFGLAVQNKEGKETVFGIRTLPTDLLHLASDPVGFVKGRFSPSVRLGTEVVTGRDQFGRKMAPGDLWIDILHQVAPIPVQSLGQAVSGTGPEIGNVGQAAKAMGGTAQTYQTPAQKMAADLAASHTEDGPIDPAGMARHRQVMAIEDQVRAGEMSYPDLMKLTYGTDQIKESELKKITDNLKKTQGMPAPMASLYSRASRLPAKEYLQLLDVSNPAERTALVPLTIQVQKRYLNKAKKDETPDERQRDPVFQRFLNMIPGVRTQSQAAPSPVIPPAVQQEMAHLESGIIQQTA